MRTTKYALFLLPLIALAVLLAGRSYSPAVTTVTVEPLTAAMEATGAKTAQITLHGWAILPWTDGSDEQMMALVQAGMSQLNISPEEVTFSSSSSDRHRLLRADVKREQFRGAVIAQILYPSQRNKQPEVYLVVNIEAAAEQIYQGWEEKIRTFITVNNGSPRISTCLVGWIDGRLEDGQYHIRLNNAFSAIHASVQDTVSDSRYLSMSGYSPLLAEKLEINGKEMNVNMAVRYSLTDNRTYILIGSPVITQEY